LRIKKIIDYSFVLKHGFFGEYPLSKQGSSTRYPDNIIIESIFGNARGLFFPQLKVPRHAEPGLGHNVHLTCMVNLALSGNVPLDWDRPFNKVDIARSGLGPVFRGWSHITLQVWVKKSNWPGNRPV
jgi:hypothetical protein